MFYSYKEFKPKLSKSVYVAPSADVIGRVILGDDVSIWHQCVLRGDVNLITIGHQTNIQDLSMLHVTKDHPLVIGSSVSVGHSVTLHGCTIGDHVLVGMGAVVLDGAEIGEGSVVAAGSLVPPNKIFPPRSMIMGNPAKVVRELTHDEAKIYHSHFKAYLKYKDEYLQSDLVKECDLSDLLT